MRLVELDRTEDSIPQEHLDLHADTSSDKEHHKPPLCLGSVIFKDALAEGLTIEVDTHNCLYTYGGRSEAWKNHGANSYNAGLVAAMNG